MSIISSLHWRQDATFEAMIYHDNVHMVANSLRELHVLAKRIGLKRSRFHGKRKGHPHYDLTRESLKRMESVDHLVVSSKLLLRQSKLMMCLSSNTTSLINP